MPSHAASLETVATKSAPWRANTPAMTQASASETNTQARRRVVFHREGWDAVGRGGRWTWRHGQAPGEPVEELTRR